MSLVEIAQFPSRKRTRGKILLAGLAFVHLAAFPAAFFVIQEGRPSYFGFLVVIVTGVVLFDLALLTSGHEDSEETARPSSTDVIRDPRAITVVLAVGAVAFVAVGTGILLYAVMTVYFSMLLLGAFSDRTAAGNRYVYLLLMVSGSFFLLYAQLSSVPYFARTADTIYHTALVLRLTESGFIQASSPGRYGNLPAFHVLMSSMIQVADQPSRLYIGAVVAVLFQITIIASYVLLRRVSASTSVSLAGALMIGISQPFLVWGTKNHPQSLSFVIMVFFLLILVTRTVGRRNTLISAAIVFVWVLTHQLSILMAISLIAVPLTSLYVYTYVRRTSFEKEIKTGWYRFSILVVTLVTYWTIVTQIMREPIAWIFYTSPAAQGVPTRGSLVEVYTNFGELVYASLPEIIDKSHHAVWLAVAALGFWTVVKTVDRSDGYRLVALMSFLPAAVFFFPNPAWIPLQGIATIARWGIAALPFVVLMVAIGVRRLLSGSPSLVHSSVTVFFVTALVFLSIGSGMANPNITDLSGYDKRTPKYLSETDHAAMEYTFAYTNGTGTYGTSEIPAYLMFYGWKYRNNPGSIDSVAADLEVGEITLLPGMNIIQYHQLIEKKTKVLVSREPYVRDPVSADQVSINETQGSRVYDTDDTIIYYRAPPQRET